MVRFLLEDKESFWLQNRLLTNSVTFSSWRSAKCPVLKFVHGSEVLEDFPSTFFNSVVKKISFLKGNCHVNDVQIFMGHNSASFITTLYLRKLLEHFFCIQIHRTFRSSYLVIALML